eukprot:1159388-Pelagomonas_calceolata.AAC.11
MAANLENLQARLPALSQLLCKDIGGCSCVSLCNFCKRCAAYLFAPAVQGRRCALLCCACYCQPLLQGVLPALLRLLCKDVGVRFFVVRATARNFCKRCAACPFAPAVQGRECALLCCACCCPQLVQGVLPALLHLLCKDISARFSVVHAAAYNFCKRCAACPFAPAVQGCQCALLCGCCCPQLQHDTAPGRFLAMHAAATKVAVQAIHGVMLQIESRDAARATLFCQANNGMVENCGQLDAEGARGHHSKAGCSKGCFCPGLACGTPACQGIIEAAAETMQVGARAFRRCCGAAVHCQVNDDVCFPAFVSSLKLPFGSMHDEHYTAFGCNTQHVWFVVAAVHNWVQTNSCMSQDHAHNDTACLCTGSYVRTAAPLTAHNSWIPQDHDAHLATAYQQMCVCMRSIAAALEALLSVMQGVQAAGWIPQDHDAHLATACLQMFIRTCSIAAALDALLAVLPSMLKQLALVEAEAAAAAAAAAGRDTSAADGDSAAKPHAGRQKQAGEPCCPLLAWHSDTEQEFAQANYNKETQKHKYTTLFIHLSKALYIGHQSCKCVMQTAAQHDCARGSDDGCM